MTQIIWFNLLLCVTLAYNETFSPLDSTYIHYPGYNPDIILNYLPHTSDIVNNDLETLPDHNDDTYNSDREQATIITSDEQSQEVTDGFAYNIERENTDRELLGITVDKDLFPELICTLLPLNSDTSTHNTGGELPGTNGEILHNDISFKRYSSLNHVKMRLQAIKNETDFITAENSQLFTLQYPTIKENIFPLIYAKKKRNFSEEQNRKHPHAGRNAHFKNRSEYRKRKKTHDKPFICKRQRPDCGQTSNHSSFLSRNETRQPKLQCENSKEFFSRKDNLKIHMKRCLINSS
ncbi:hypothetical protein LOAG_11983 [Loa loa]|uniref:Zinc finger protein n=1 Tax=Loa loa TaxID=7209 RepID=A0A1S0TMJ0_LOALO|nr:hypothetical protein LOAG_11983 [Loa loa]EFO16523.2 hypothetical protein LOAG_11983 [Loa loa]